MDQIDGLYGSILSNPNIIEAAKWYQKAERLGDETASSAIRRLEEYPEVYVSLNKSDFTNPNGPSPGSLDEAQRFLDSNPQQSFKIVEWNALAGDAEAKLKLAKFYFNGVGTTQDFKKSMRWLWLAAEGGNLDAMYGLSEQYKNGDYIPFDLGNMRKLLSIFVKSR
jgi:TPR repeat protein